jgi:hypothetical protein
VDTLLDCNSALAKDATPFILSLPSSQKSSFEQSIVVFKKRICQKKIFKPAGKVTNKLSTLNSPELADRSEAKSAKRSFALKIKKNRDILSFDSELRFVLLASQAFSNSSSFISIQLKICPVFRRESL